MATKKKAAVHHKAPGEVLYEVWLTFLPPGDYRRNQPWAELDSDTRRKYSEKAKVVADAYNSAHASG